MTDQTKEIVPTYSIREIFESTTMTEQMVYEDKLLIIEDQQLRSVLLGTTWKLDAIIILWTERGEMEYSLNHFPNKVYPNSLTIVPSHQLIQIKYQKDLVRKGLIISHALFDDIRLTTEARVQMLLSLQQRSNFPMHEGEIMPLRSYFHLLKEVIVKPDSVYKYEQIKSLLYASLNCVGEVLHPHISFPDTRGKGNRKQVIYNRFLTLLQSHYRQQHFVKWYAKELCITQKYLSDIVMSVSGKKAVSWIHELLIADAKELVRNTNYTIYEISDILQFPNPSFFGRFFLNQTGSSPMSYRRKLQ